MRSGKLYSAHTLLKAGWVTGDGRLTVKVDRD